LKKCQSSREKVTGQTYLNPNTGRTLHDGVLTPIKQSVGFQEKHALATLYQNQMRLPWTK